MNKKFTTYLCCLIIVVFAMTLTIIGPLLIKISDTFSLSIAQSGIIFTANFVGFVIFIFAGSVLSDRFGKKLMLSTSLIGFAFSLLLFPLSPNFYTACIIVLFIGGFGGIIESMANALIADLNTVNTSFYINLAQIFFGIGAVIGPIAAGLIISNDISWKFCYYVLGGLTGVFAMIFIANKLPKLPKVEKVTIADFKRLFTNKKFMLICLCMVFYTGSEIGAWGWMSTFLKQSMKFSIMKASISVAVFWASMTMGRLICGRLTFKYSLKKMIIVLAISSSIVTALSGLVTNEAIMWVVIAAMGFSYSSQWPFMASYGSEYSNAPSGMVFSLLIGSGGVGNMLVPLIMGIIGDNIDIRVSMISPAVLLLAVGLIFIGIDPKDRGEMLKM